MLKKIAILTGAGMSAESGIKTFRDHGGLWEEFDVMTVASLDGWHADKELVLRFYNDRRKQLKDVEPNQGHVDLLLFEQAHDVVIVTQNVDDLHERAGSSNIIHLHGELNKVRCTVNDSLIYDWDKDLNLGDVSDDGHQLRPHIVWFGEMVPLLDKAAAEVATADYIIIIGTSMQVYPAAGLISYAKPNAHIYYIDPKPQLNHELRMAANVTVIEEKATVGVRKCYELMQEN
jgi:NAD-dependent deacetylase